MQVLDVSTRGTAAEAVRVLAVSDAPACEGVTDAFVGHVLGVHLGASAVVRQKREDTSFEGLYRAGQLTTIPAGWTTSCWTRSATSFAHVHLGPAFLSRAVGRERAELVPRFRFEDAVCRELVLSMFAEARARGAEARLYLESAGVVLAHRLAGPRAQEAGERAGLPAAVQRRVVDFMHEKLAEAPGLQELADVAGMSLANFARLFRASTGESPHRYFNRLRLEHAKALLATTERQVVEVALAVGFSNPSHFAAFFRAATGESPRAFRRRAR